MVVLAVGAWTIGGCVRMTTGREFLSKYSTNIDVANPDSTDLPCRIFLGEMQAGYYDLQDLIPAAQGGGFLGKRILWRCPVSELPHDFSYKVRPGDVILDRRPGAKHTYLIQWFRAQGGS